MNIFKLVEQLVASSQMSAKLVKVAGVTKR